MIPGTSCYISFVFLLLIQGSQSSGCGARHTFSSVPQGGVWGSTLLKGLLIVMLHSKTTLEKLRAWGIFLKLPWED